MPKTIRTDKWELSLSNNDKLVLSNTIEKFRLFCKALSIVVLNNWKGLCQAKSFCSVTEKLIHKTSKNLNPIHSYFISRFYKFPS